MTGKIKLVHSGGNAVILSAPDSNPASDRTLKLPGDADGTIATTATAGKILQVKSTLIKDVKSTQSTSYSDISGFNVNITPSATSSKILVQISMRVSGESNEGYFQLVRRVGGTDTAIGNGTGGNHAAFTSIFFPVVYGYYDMVSTSFVMLDSPNTTSAITYKVQWRLLQGQTLYLGRTYYSTTASNYSGSSSNSITVQEVAS